MPPETFTQPNLEDPTVGKDWESTPNVLKTSKKVIIGDGDSATIIDPIKGITSPSLTTPIWTYYDKVSWTNESTTKGFYSPLLPVHDEWMVIMDIHNTATTSRIDPRCIINAITSSANYSGFYSDGSSGYFKYATGIHSGWLLASMVSDNYCSLVGEIHIQGRHNNGEKGMWCQFTRTGDLNTLIGKEGIMTGDSNDVSRIEFTFGASVTGKAELYYRDNR